MKFIKSYILIAFITLFCFCNKKAELIADIKKVPYKKTINVSQNIKDWGYFKPGTYWIYRDSITSAIDSFYVTGVNTNTTQAWWTEDTVYYREEISLNCIHSNYLGQPFELNYYITSFPYDLIMYYDGVYAFPIFDPDSSHITNVIGHGIMENKSIPLYSLNSNNYANTRYLYFDYRWQQHSAPISVFNGCNYWCKNIGLLKLSVLPCSSYYRSLELLRYHIVQ